MKKFKYPLAIKGTTEQLKSLSTKLIELGYVQEGKITYNDTYLVTNYCDRFGTFGYAHLRNTKDRTDVSASNPDLVLALAAMVDDNNAYVGEYWSLKDKIVKITNVRDCDGWFLYKGMQDINNYHNPQHYHHDKCSKEEIISHFSPKTFKGSEHKTMEKKIIGYKLKDDCKQYEEAASNILKFSDGKLTNYAEGYNFTFDSPASDFLRKAGVLDLWFEPVYEEKSSFKTGDWVIGWHSPLIEKKTKAWQVERVDQDFVYPISGGSTGIEDVRFATPEEIAAAQTKVITLRCEGGTFDVEVSKKGIYYRPESKWLDIATLNQAVNPVISSISVSGYDFKLVIDTVDSGCKKKVPMSDWKNALNAFHELWK